MLKNYLKFISSTWIILALLSISFSPAFSLTPEQETEYQNAQGFVKDGKFDEAQTIFTKLKKDAPSELKVILGGIDTTIEQAHDLKINGNHGWEGKIFQAYAELKRIFRGYSTTPEIYLSFAKCYWVNERVIKAESSLEKAFFFKPDYMEAYSFRGDMYFEEGLARKKKIEREKEDRGNQDNLIKLRNYRKRAEESFTILLNLPNLDNDTKARYHFKLGSVYLDLYDKKDKAKGQWDQAIAIAPESQWAKQAQERLSTVK